MKYKIGELLEIKHKATISINTVGDYRAEVANAGQLFLIIDCGPIGYTLLSQESGNSSLWNVGGNAYSNLDSVMEDNFKKVV